MASCDKCDAKCCKYVAVAIDEPKSAESWDEIKWFLMHENISVYKEDDGEWSVEFQTKCKHLKGNKCEIYGERPLVCRNHGIDECEGEGHDAEVLFLKPEDVDEYLKK